MNFIFKLYMYVFFKKNKFISNWSITRKNFINLKWFEGCFGQEKSIDRLLSPHITNELR